MHTTNPGLVLCLCYQAPSERPGAGPSLPPGGAPSEMGMGNSVAEKEVRHIKEIKLIDLNIYGTEPFIAFYSLLKS